MSVLLIMIIFVFLCDFVLESINKKFYFISCMGILDILTILSLFFDIHWIYNSLVSNYNDEIVFNDTNARNQVKYAIRIPSFAILTIRTMILLRLIR